MKDHYRLENRENKLIEYWKNEAKKGNKNATLVLDFHDYLSTYEAKIVGHYRRVTMLSRLKYAEKHFDNPFDKTDEKGILRAINRLENAKLIKTGKKRSPHTTNTEKLVLRKFFTWLAYKDDEHLSVIDKKRADGIPRIVKLIRTNYTKEEKFEVRKTEDDILTRDEVDSMLKNAPTVCDKAMIGFLYETGCRVGELCNLKLKDVKFSGHGNEIKLTLFGKTGARDIVIRRYAKYLMPWLNTHPYREDKERSLFISNFGLDISPSAVRNKLKRIATGCGISNYKGGVYRAGKKIYPHIFRHTSATHKLSGIFDGAQWPESIVKQWHGWSPTSKMLGVYGHLSSNDAIDFVRGTFSDKNKKEYFCECKKCKAVNETGDYMCWWCNLPLEFAEESKMVIKTDSERAKELLKDAIREIVLAQSTATKTAVQPLTPMNMILAQLQSQQALE